jgi:MoaD family protein
MLRVQVRYYASLRRATGREAEVMYMDDGAAVGDVVTKASASYPHIAEMNPSILTACNSKYASRDQELADGDIVDLMPPVSGG